MYCIVLYCIVWGGSRREGRRPRLNNRARERRGRPGTGRGTEWFSRLADVRNDIMDRVQHFNTGWILFEMVVVSDHVIALATSVLLKFIAGSGMENRIRHDLTSCLDWQLSVWPWWHHSIGMEWNFGSCLTGWVYHFTYGYGVYILKVILIYFKKLSGSSHMKIEEKRWCISIIRSRSIWSKRKPRIQINISLSTIYSCVGKVKGIDLVLKLYQNYEWIFSKS